LITISAERCNGCAACVEVCPNDAIQLVDNHAIVDGQLCLDCKLCVDACPTGAIAVVEIAIQPAIERIPVPVPRPEMVTVKVQESPPALRTRVLPAVGAALTWFGREVVPRLADTLLERWQRDALDRPGGNAPRNGGSHRNGGRRRRRRQRGRPRRDPNQGK
jgi:NAD-dependent dihydropyrimidine dehydrogenase PreA subunit